MTTSIASLNQQRKALLHLYRHHPQPEVRHRAHILLLRADPNLDADGAEAIEAIVRTAYERLRKAQE